MQPPGPKDEQKPRKRKSTDLHAQTPSKRIKTAETPSNTRFQSNAAELAVTPSLSRKLFSPAVPTSIGPTPQRDGRVLGLFDLLGGADAETPSKGAGNQDTNSFAQIQATPSKSASGLDADSTIKLGRTPQSSSKQRMLDGFMTPLKKRDEYTAGKSPSSVSRLQFATPAFLRRAPMPPVDENGEFKSPNPIRLPRKPLVRGLSSIVASLRKVEEEQLDDDLEALHEMENEAASGAPKPEPKSKPTEEDVLVEDSQAPNMLLGGFDDEAMYDSPVEDDVDRNGQPLRVFKKKGQKRTTRLVKMRPTRSKRPTQTMEEAEESENEENVVPETQIDGTKDGANEDSILQLSDSDFGGSDDEEQDDDHVAKKRKTKKSQTKPEIKEGPIKKAARKVNAMAHANFRRLKLRNNGAKGGPGYNSRFRRRR